MEITVPRSNSTINLGDSLYQSLKRLLDITVASLMLVALAPLMLLIAVLIKLDSPGPVIFTQERVGSRRRLINGRVVWEIEPFPFFKFRSMVNNASQSMHAEHIKAYVNGEVKAESEGETTKLTHDPRITRIGRIIRRTSIDELPQLLNVLRGEMSLVGPRPVPTYEFESYQPRHRERMCAVPGLTGQWQVEGRGTSSFEEQMQLDIDYVRNKSIWKDISLILLTVPAVISGRGAG